MPGTVSTSDQYDLCMCRCARLYLLYCILFTQKQQTWVMVRVAVVQRAIKACGPQR